MPYTGFPGGSVIKNLPANSGDLGSVLGSRRSGNPLQYSWLGNPLDRGVWRAQKCTILIHGIARVGHNWVTEHACPHALSTLNTSSCQMHIKISVIVFDWTNILLFYQMLISWYFMVNINCFSCTRILINIYMLWFQFGAISSTLLTQARALHFTLGDLA